ncbi:MAG: multidrug efflux RND transporter permease subunit [Woeseiaceae bacterium]|nr:multidrug efflux RND transporter permease subunit [Woeseiaceae bacterium]
MNPSRVFVDRPIFAGVLSIFVLIAGLIAIPNLPVSEYPEVVPPTIQVTATYPGANPQTISETVAAPLEEAINGVENMIYMKSVASSDGVLQVQITFAGGTDIDLAQVQVQNRVAIALPRLPEAVRALGVATAKSSPNLTMVVHLTSPEGDYDGFYLANYVTINILDEIARLPGVGQALVFGAGDYSMRVWLDPEKVASRDLTAGDVINAIREQNIQVSAGIIGGPPQSGAGFTQYSLSARGRLQTVEEFENIVLKTGAAPGSVTTLGDVARVELGSETYSLRSRLNSQEAAAIPIFQSPGANSIALSDAVRAKMDELSADFPPGVSWDVAYDPTVFVRQSINSVVTTLLEAVLLVVIVVVLFLQTWRASIIPLLAVPVSIIGTFAVLLLLGFSINVLTLFGLVLAIGIVVDDAIVVVENVERHIEMGKSPREAAHVAMQEVSGPIIAISLVLAAVFVPLAFLSGVTGEFYRQFAVTISAAVLISAFNSLTLSPAMAAVLLKPRGAPPGRIGRTIDFLFGWIFRPFNRVFDRGAKAYGTNTTRNLNRSGRLSIIYLLLIGIAIMGFRAVPGGFIPVQDKQYLFAVALLPEGANIQRTDEMLAEMSEIALAVPGIRSTVAFPGLNGVHFVNTPNIGTMFIGIDPQGEREATAAELAAQLSGAFSMIEEGLAFALMPPPVLGLGNSSGVEMYVQDRGNLGFGELNAQTQALAGALRQTPGFDPYSVLSSFQSNVPQLEAVVDRRKVKEQNLQLNEVFDALQVYLGSAYVNDFNLFGRTYSVYVQADAPYRDEVSDVARLKVRNAEGRMIPVTSVLEVEESYGPDPVIRYNGYPAADLSAGIDPALMSSSEALNVVTALAGASLPKGMGFEWTGLTFQEATQGNTAIIVFPLCILFVFLILAALYESWSLPLAVILIVPLCLLSAIAGIWSLNTIKGFIFGMQIASGMIPPPPVSVPPTFLDNNIFTQIGLVVLMGLACKNAILIVEFARDLERMGRSIAEAAIEAARIRLRPILMTSFAFIAGVVPLVFASGAGSEVRHVMGVTVFFGMLGVTFFGLIFTPVIYVLIRKLETRSERLGEVAHEAV